MGNQNIIDDKATDDKDATENTQPSGEPASENLPENAPVVYMTKDISPKGLIRIYEALGRQASGKVGIKVHMGEPGGNNYLNPDLIKDFVLSVKGTFVDCNTAYGGRRATTEMHMQAAKDHGFTAYTSVDIMDAEAEINLPVKNGKHLKEALVGSHIKDYDFFVVLSHFKGHAMGGFGGAIILSVLFQRYIPADSFASLFGSERKFGILMASTIGVPLYACSGGTIPLLVEWLNEGMSMGSAAAFMITGPSTKITNLGALKAVLGLR